MWAAIQAWYIEHSCEPDAVDWMRGAILDGVLPQNYWAHRHSLRFQPKRWQWIDPEKEVNASITAIEARLKSRTRIIAEGGEDIEDTFDEIAQEEQLAKDKNIDLNPVKPAAKKPKEPADEETEAPAEEAAEKSARLSAVRR